MTQPNDPTEGLKPLDPAETCTAAAGAARLAAREAPLGSPARIYGTTLAEVFETIGHDLTELGGMSPRMRRAGVDLAGAFLRMHRDDEKLRARFAEMVDAGEPFAVATEVMTTNAEISPAGSSPRALADAFLDLFAYVLSDDTVIDEVLLDLLRKLAIAVIEIDDAMPAEIEQIDLGALDVPVGNYPDGTVATIQIPAGNPLADVTGGLVGEIRTVVSSAVESLAEFEQGAAYARAAGVDAPEGSRRFRLRSVGAEPVRVDVYDQAGERIAIISEAPSKHGEHAEWHVGVIVCGAAKSAASISFGRVVEHLDRFLAEHIGGPS